jgi:hypothetical protein
MLAACIDAQSGTRNIDFGTIKRRVVLQSGGKVECCAQSFGTMECCCGLDEFDVTVKMDWEGIFRRAHEDIAVRVMLPHPEFLITYPPQLGITTTKIGRKAAHGVKHFLRLRNGHMHSDPIACRRTVARLLLDPMPGEPRMHSVDAARMGSKELLDFFLRQMFPVARVKRVADLREVLLELGEPWSGQRDAQLDDVRGRGAAQVRPAARGRDSLAESELVCGVGWDC